MRQPDGSFRNELLVIRRSVQGPVVAQAPDGRPLAARVVGLIDHQFGALQEWWDMAHARSLGEFEAALRQLQIPMFMVIYADRDGHILSLFNGRVPVRPSGDFSTWLGPVPGDTSAPCGPTSIPTRTCPRWWTRRPAGCRTATAHPGT